ncbi:MAG: AMP-binding protein [Prevotellaceae bacterium]|jgi:long-chain acyl-CoA synthetase|nr:AMP-binding protein [Prevotellaceae bacterium]
MNMNVSEIKTLRDLLTYGTLTHAQRPMNCFVDEQPVSYSRFGERVEELQRKFEALNLCFGDKVAIYTHNTPNYAVVYFALAARGIVTVPLLPDFSTLEIENILNHSESKAIFVSERLRSKLDGLNLPFIKSRISMDDFSAFEHLDEAKNDFADDNRLPEPDDLASIVYTSGTTGKSKGVMLTHGNLVWQIKMVHEIQPVQAEDTFISILPLPHTYEGSLGFLLPFYAGASVYYLEKPPTAAVLLPAMRKIRPTYMLSVPLIIEKIFRGNILPTIKSKFITRNLYKIALGRKFLHRAAAKKLYKLLGGRLVFFGIGGAKLDPTVERFLYEGKFPYAIGYGLTETAPLLSAAVNRNVKPESAGFRLKDVEMLVHARDTETGIGELWVRTPCLMKGYYREPELTAAVMTPEGWFKTGDLISVNPSGRIYIKGRLKNVILGSSGENIYPEEIESVINNFKFVQESLVVEQKGKLVAMVRFNREELEKQYNRIKEEWLQNMENKYREFEEKCSEVEQKIEELKIELKEYVNARVNRFSQISAVVALSSDFEKTSTMKIKRYLYS